MKDFFDVTEFLYQKFLLDIYRHCEKLGITHIPVAEKEKMAVEMVDFVGKVINSLESGKPLIKVNKRDMKKISKSVIKKVNEDEFAKSVLKYYTASRKLRKKDIEPCLTTAAIAVISRGSRMDAKTLEKKVKSARPFVFRVASLLSPAIGLHEKLLSDDRPEGIFLPEQDMSFTKYIG